MSENMKSAPIELPDPEDRIVDQGMGNYRQAREKLGKQPEIPSRGTEQQDINPTTPRDKEIKDKDSELAREQRQGKGHLPYGHDPYPPKLEQE